MPYALERYPGLAGGTSHRFAGKAIVLNTLTGHHYSKDPIRIEKAKAQLRILEAAQTKEKK